MRLGNRLRVHSSFFAFLVVMYDVSYSRFIAKYFFSNMLEIRWVKENPQPGCFLMGKT
jgi:hypothetical protein